MIYVKHSLLLTLLLVLTFSVLEGCTPKEAPPTPQQSSEAPAETQEQPTAKPELAEEASAVDGDPIAALEKAPPMPKGYESTAEIMTAIAKNEIELLDENVPVPDGVKEIAGIEYCNVEGISLKLDLALPEKAEAPLPGLIFIHGGAWVGGERKVYHLYTYKFAREGYA
ncbi:MAG: hypothetical protein U9Q79_07820, partial [Candidatus Hydrogenedentes bacterium]|nr:hypothetical protein [Candidatus Hydrogenedentota bacterium]